MTAFAPPPDLPLARQVCDEPQIPGEVWLPAQRSSERLHRGAAGGRYAHTHTYLRRGLMAMWRLGGSLNITAFNTRYVDQITLLGRNYSGPSKYYFF